MVYDFIEVTKESTRMCDAHHSCRNCPVSSDNNGIDISCASLRLRNPDVYAGLVMKWAK